MPSTSSSTANPFPRPGESVTAQRSSPHHSSDAGSTAPWALGMPSFPRAPPSGPPLRASTSMRPIRRAGSASGPRSAKSTRASMNARTAAAWQEAGCLQEAQTAPSPLVREQALLTFSPPRTELVCRISDLDVRTMALRGSGRARRVLERRSGNDRTPDSSLNETRTYAIGVVAKEMK